MGSFCARFLLLLLLALSATAQMKLNGDQLLRFVRSSIKLKHPDEQVANYLKKVALTEQVPVGKLEDLLAEGIGPKTYDALMALSKSSASLPLAKLPPPAGSAAAAPSIPPPSAAEQRQLIQELREYALNYDKQLPDFLCTQVTRRFYDPSGLEYWVSADTVTAKLSYFQRREEKKVLFVNNQYQDIDWDKLGGASSTGEFGALLREIFEPGSEAVFQWERWGTLRGKRNHVIHYRVAQRNSQWTISYEKVQSITPAYEGRIYAEAGTGLVTRVTLEALDIPASFPVQMARTQLDYDYATISGNTFLLPLRAEVKMREGKLLIRNDIEFRNYRKFGADTSITFETPEPLASDLVNEESTKPPKPIQP
jgi:hypothetical protein